MTAEELLPCPFCGGPAKLVNEPNERDGEAWAYASCKHRCDLHPLTGSSSSTGYVCGREWVSIRTLEEAQDLAIKSVIKKWNKRDGQNVNV